MPTPKPELKTTRVSLDSLEQWTGNARRAVYLIGGPGTGKSTALRHVLKGVRLSPAAPVHPAYPLVTGQEFVESSGVYLGKRGGAFPGTDRLSMAVSPQAVEWALSNRLPDVIVGEGARLGSAKFLAALASNTDLAALASNTDLVVGHLIADEYVTAQRFAARGSNQKPSWVAGRVTAAANAARDLAGAGFNVLTVNTDQMTPEAVAAPFRSHLGLKGEP